MVTRMITVKVTKAYRAAFTGMGKGDSFYTPETFWKDSKYEHAKKLF